MKSGNIKETAIDMKPKFCPWCSDYAQILELKVGICYICIVYCHDCDYGYLRNYNTIVGLSIISSNRAKKKAIKIWNNKDKRIKP